MNDLIANPWLVCQIGAREHYAIPRALHARGALGGLFTDSWISPTHPLSQLPGSQRLQGRFHPDLADAKIYAPNSRFLAFEIQKYLTKRSGWSATIDRNRLFQQMVIKRLSSVRATTISKNSPTLFSYSYASLELFRFAKSRGWKTVLGQIDPGPEEERIVEKELEKYPHLTSNWQPAPPEYWNSWREELTLADRIIVNSEWSRQCLLKEGIPNHKMEILPLVYEEKSAGLKRREEKNEKESGKKSSNFRLLFLGQIILRKGIARLLDTMRLLKDEPIELILAGPSEINSSAWEDLPNVSWIGPVPRSEVNRIYENADCFILPTLSDGYALTQLEALYFGLPVIASKNCGAAVTDGTNGWILEDLEPNTIAATIQKARITALDNIKPPCYSTESLGSSLIR